MLMLLKTGKISNLKVHIELNPEGKRHLCNHCGNQSTTEEHFNRHKSAAHNATYQCEFESKHKNDLIRHGIRERSIIT